MTRGPQNPLIKSEPDACSFDDLWAAPNRATRWDGVRDYQARSVIRNDMRVGDRVRFYHSGTDSLAVVGVAEVVRDGCPEYTVLDPRDAHLDGKSSPDAPTWITVDSRAVVRFARPVPLDELRRTPGLKGMPLLQRVYRLFMQPVRAEGREIIRAIGPREAVVGSATPGDNRPRVGR